MQTISRTNMKINLIGFIIISLTFILRLLDYHDPDTINFYLKTSCILLYLLFFVLWIFSLNWRIIQNTSKKYLIMIAVFELLWITIRTLKYHFFTYELLCRYCWYLYYLSHLMIATLCLFLAVSIRKPETFKPSKILWGFMYVSIALFLLVITNDLHNAVFIIPPGLNGLEVGNYHYGLGFYIIISYNILCFIASYGIILVKCRIYSRKIMHTFPIILIITGTIVYICYAMGLFHRFDITVFSCYFITIALEMCIQSGLIMPNIGYIELFSTGNLHAVITDEQFMPLFSSSGYQELTDADKQNIKNTPVIMENGLRLSACPINRGNVLWQDDVSTLQQTIQELSEKNEYLQEKNSLIKQANRYRIKEQQLIEKNRLYNRILIQTKSEIEQYAALVEQLSEESDPVKEKYIAFKMACVGTFIKRHNNLVFLNEIDNAIAPSELSYCIEESLSAMRLGGIECTCSYNLTKPITFEKISRMYKTFYNILMDMLNNISSVCVYLVEENNDNGADASIIIRIMCNSDINIEAADKENVKIEKEEDEWVVIIK